ncbi:hypothetical protein [Demequina sp. SO4-18]|uniref:hypothetical protein n=1 Tax=Demequina sp. SO4-18 TaxID=3401026 RepID=UPI003B5C985A
MDIEASESSCSEVAGRDEGSSETSGAGSPASVVDGSGLVEGSGLAVGSDVVVIVDSGVGEASGVAPAGTATNVDNAAIETAAASPAHLREICCNTIDLLHPPRSVSADAMSGRDPHATMHHWTGDSGHSS